LSFKIKLLHALKVLTTQGVVHACFEQPCVSLSAGQVLPPNEATALMPLLLDRNPSPQITEHTDHVLQDEKRQFAGQDCILQVCHL
jgi:hypothetical protein